MKQGMKLESDVTAFYGALAAGQPPSVTYDSPYNTHFYAGLPPGPIHMPPIAYIDAVLNYEHHDYIFMCAKGDGSGRHYFAKTLTEHSRNRTLYIKALEAANIR